MATKSTIKTIMQNTCTNSSVPTSGTLTQAEVTQLANELAAALNALNGDNIYPPTPRL